MTVDEAIRHLYTYSSTNGSGQTTQEQHEEAKRMAINALTAQQWITCSNCARNADNGGLYPDGRTRCPIQEHYALLKDGYCHLAEPWKGEQE